MLEIPDDSLENARRYVRRKRIFYTVVGIWLALCLMWFTIDLRDDSSSWWFYWPMLGTGIAVVVASVLNYIVPRLYPWSSEEFRPHATPE